VKNLDTDALILFIILMVVFVLFLVAIFYARTLVGEKNQYPSSFLCQDGDKVRSVSECLIDNFFTDKGIQHKYEDIIDPSEGKYKYDWYFPSTKLYLEFFGYHGRKYQQSRATKEHIYKKNHMRMIAIEPQDLANLEQKLLLKIGADTWDKIAGGKHCPHCGKDLDNRL
jgi:hypothetical protein